MIVNQNPSQNDAAALGRSASADPARLLELGFEMAATPTALLDGSGHYIRVNGAFAQLFGQPTSFFPGVSFVELTHPDDRARDAGFIERLRKTEAKQLSLQKRYLRADGSTIFARTTVSVIHLEAGVPSVLMAEVMDHTALHGAEEALHATEERLALALQATDDGLWDWDAASGDLVLSDRWFQMLGYEPGELPPNMTTWQNLVHPDDLPTAYAQLEANTRGDIRQMDFVMRMRCKDGSWLWVRDRGKVVSRNDDGSPKRVVGTHMNISAQREQERLLHAQTTLLESVLANIPVAIDIINPDGGIEYVNAYAERLLGWSLDDMRRMDVMLQVYPDAEYRAQVYASMLEGSTQTRDWKVHTRDGRVLTMEWTNIRLPDGRVIGMGNDVTAARAAESAEARLAAQMQQAQKLEGLGLLAGGIAHDFNNLLVGVLGNATLAQELLPSDSEAAQLITEVRGAATRAAELTRQLLAYAGKGRFVVGSVDLSLLAGEMAALLRAATSKQAVLRQVLAPGLPAVEADAAQIRQVLMNLITNASDALGDEPGTITLKTSVCTPDERERSAVFGGTPLPPGRYVCVEVSDTGSGMSPQTIGQIFDPFFTTKSSGHGLGLAATLGIVRSHHGGIAVHSTPGEGSAFLVYLPAVDRTMRPSPAANISKLDVMVGEGDILLADDEPAVRQFAARVLDRAGFSVTPCVDGAEAVARFKTDPSRWRAVVLDLTMPNLGGQDALMQMRALRPDVPAVLCSGYASEELRAEVTALSSMTFVAKPYTLARLVSAVLDVSGKS